MRYRILFLVVFFCTAIWANVKLESIFGDNMVLQRNSQANFWGTAEPAEEITVSGSWGATSKVTANKKGRWELKLNTPEAGGPFKITIKGKNTIILNNIMSGEVWLCTGQSNMECQMSFYKDTGKAIQEANYPNIRFFKVGRTTSPKEKRKSINGSWMVCSPKTASQFSATGYYFGLELYKALKIPVGLIQCAWGGTCIEAWTPWEKQKHIERLNHYKEYAAKAVKTYDVAKEKEIHKAKMKKYKEDYKLWESSGKKGRKPQYPRMKRHPINHCNYPSTLYNAMLYPVAPYTIKGAIWYQGESNANRAKEYGKQLENMIVSWRKLWGQGDFPFYFVQLPAFMKAWRSPVEESASWAVLREQFSNVAKTIPNTAMAITLELGEANDIHPQQKSKVGNRLARLALNKDYGKKDLVWTGPYMKSCEFINDKAIIKFETGGSELAIGNGEVLKGFALYTDKGNYIQANAKILNNNTIEVSSPLVPKPTIVYYAWAQNPQGANLINKAGLPASPFRYGEKPAINLLRQVLADKEKEYIEVYHIDPKYTRFSIDNKFIYTADNSNKVTKPFTKIAYFLGMQSNSGKIEYVFIEMDPFTEDIKKIGVPDIASGAFFQKEVQNVTVISNVNKVKNGTFAKGCNIEFSPYNYSQQNTKNIPNASSKIFDFGDNLVVKSKRGYGCMQIHNFAQQQSIMCFNNFFSGSHADIGIGNSSRDDASDWTFSYNAKKWAYIELKVMVK